MEIKSGNVTSGSLHVRVTPEVEALQTEILKHSELLTRMRLATIGGQFNTFEDGLAIIAEYVDVILHGMYGADEISDLAVMLTNKLIEKRTPLA